MSQVPCKHSSSKSGNLRHFWRHHFLKTLPNPQLSFRMKIFIFLSSGTRYKVSWYQKTLFSIRVQTWPPHKGSKSILMTIHPIKWILMSILIYGSPLLVLILTSCYYAIWRVVRPSQSIMWNYPPWLTKGTSPLSHYNTSFICFLILLVNIVFIFHKQKWTTSIINIYLFIYLYF